MDTPRRIGAIIAIALVVAYCTISDANRYDVFSKMMSDIEALRVRLHSLETQIDEFEGANKRIRIYLATRGDMNRVLTSLGAMPFLSNLSDDEVSAITEVLTVMAPEDWAHELEEGTTLSEAQIQWLVGAGTPVDLVEADAGGTSPRLST